MLKSDIVVHNLLKTIVLWLNNLCEGGGMLIFWQLTIPGGAVAGSISEPNHVTINTR